MLDNWYVIRSGTEEGPFTGNELKAMCESGSVQRGTMVRWGKRDAPKPIELSAAFNLMPTPPPPVRRLDPRQLVASVIFWGFWGAVAYSTAAMLIEVQSPTLTVVVLAAIAFLVVFVWTLGPRGRRFR